MFCGGRPLTKEHVYPQWLRDALPVAEARFRTTDLADQFLWEQKTFDIEVRAVCKKCNGGWMGDLEGEVSRWLADPILYGGTLTLTVAQQRTLALWAIKTAFVLEAYRKGRTIDHLPEWHAYWMPRTRASGENADPPPGISVVMFGRQLEITVAGIQHFTVSRSGGIVTRQPPNDSKGYVATFVVGYVGFQILGVNIRAEGAPRVVYPPRDLERTISLWPPLGRTVMWPPDLVMTTEDVLKFAFGE